MDREYESWEPLSEIAQMDGIDASLTQLYNWESKRKTNGFPEPKATQGRYKFFDVEEVRKWVVLRRKLKGIGRGAELNAKR